MSTFLRSAILIVFLPLFSASPRSLSSPRVELKGVPDGGIQPEVAVGRDGTVHLVNFKGDPSRGDLLYAKSKDGLNFSNPIRVNSVDRMPLQSATFAALGSPWAGRETCMSPGMPLQS